MAGTIETPDPHQAWVDPETGKPTMYFFSLIEALLNGPESNSIGTILSGQSTTQAQVDGIVTGDQEQAEENLVTDITVTASLDNVSGSGVGTVTSVPTTISVSGGTPPYSVSWVATNGVTLTANSVSSLGADGDFSVTFERAMTPGQWLYSNQKVTITDSAGSPLTGETVVSVTLVEISTGLDIGAA